MTTEFTAQVAAAGVKPNVASKERKEAVGKQQGEVKAKKDEEASAKQAKSEKQAEPENQAKATAAGVARRAQQIQQFTQSLKRDLQFSIDEESGKPVIKVYDAETKELIRQIPPGELVKPGPGREGNKGVLLRVKA